MSLRLEKKIKISYNLELLSGLHIGNSSENVEIGGVDNPVVRKTIDGTPYIPGSSIKGKIRSLLEQIAGAADVGGNDEVNNLFGFTGSNINEACASKLIVRDAYLTKDSKKILEESDSTDMPYTEIKFENTINRISGKADNPRQTERIPAGTIFAVEFVINIWNEDNEDNEDNLIALLKKGINALENDYLGGSGSRGYGQVAFTKEEIVPINLQN